MKEANRLKHINEYYFSKKLAEISRLSESGKSIINLGIGNPDISPSKKVLDKMIETVAMKNIHGYQSYRGTLLFRKSIADFYNKYYDVKINPENEILPLTGSKEGIMHISMTFLNKNDKVLIPNPGYMTYTSATLLAGGKPVYYDLFEKNNWLPDLKKLSKLNLKKVKIMWINYPHMPTGAVANKIFLKKIISFGKQYNILIVNDNPYSFILNNERQSLLKYDMDFENILELNSLSKSHNMAGWRIGMLLGNKEHINSVLKFKSNMDSGMFLATQLAAVEALKLSDKWFENINKIYRKRKKIGYKIFDNLKIKASKNQAGLFLWGKIPKGKDSKKFTDELLKNTGIFLAPGFIFGSNGKQFVRLSLTNNIKILNEALLRIKKIMV